MKRFISAVLLITPLVFGVTACKKAHNAGNDSMSVSGGKIEASASSTVSGASARPRE